LQQAAAALPAVLTFFHRRRSSGEIILIFRALRDCKLDPPKRFSFHKPLAMQLGA
jgi:hypothetical protein